MDKISYTTEKGRCLQRCPYGEDRQLGSGGCVACCYNAGHDNEEKWIKCLRHEDKKTQITIEQFKKDYNDWPGGIEKLAEIAERVKGDLGRAAHNYLVALDDLRNVLNDNDYKWG